MLVLSSLEELVKGVDRLVSLPEVCVLINDLINDPLCNVSELAQVISQDPDLTARLLKLVNGPYYQFSMPIDTVSRAIVLVGLAELQNMVIATSAVETFGKLPAEKINMASFWRHSVFCAVVARRLARECHVLHPERLFVAGLLHDIGRLLILYKKTDQVEQILQTQSQQNCSIAEAERAILCFDHADAGEALLKSWGLPHGLCQTVKYHHCPQQATEFILETSIIHVSNIMAQALDVSDRDNFTLECDSFAWKQLGIAESSIKPILHEAVFQFLETLELLIPGASTPLNLP